MTVLAERLARKRARRVVLPVDVEPLSDEQQARAVELLAAAAAGGEGAAEAMAEATAIRDSARVDVEFQAMDALVWERIVAAYPAPEGDDGGVDRIAALPVVAAICAVDESLQDDDTWRDLLESWSYGERLLLWGTLLTLNSASPQPHVPKD